MLYIYTIGGHTYNYPNVRSSAAFHSHACREEVCVYLCMHVCVCVCVCVCATVAGFTSQIWP